METNKTDKYGNLENFNGKPNPAYQMKQCKYKSKCLQSKLDCKNYERCTIYQRFASLEDTMIYEEELGIGAIVKLPEIKFKKKNLRR